MTTLVECPNNDDYSGTCVIRQLSFPTSRDIRENCMVPSISLTLVDKKKNLVFFKTVGFPVSLLLIIFNLFSSSN